MTLDYIGGMENRSRDEITARILEAANKGTTKTEIMYEAFLTYDKLSEYCVVLLESRLDRIPERRTNLQDNREGIVFFARSQRN